MRMGHISEKQNAKDNKKTKQKKHTHTHKKKKQPLNAPRLYSDLFKTFKRKSLTALIQEEPLFLCLQCTITCTQEGQAMMSQATMKWGTYMVKPTWNAVLSYLSTHTVYQYKIQFFSLSSFWGDMTILENGYRKT